MSWQAMAWADALPYDTMKPLATRVLFKLANVAAHDGTRAYRNKHEMAHELGVDQRSVQRALKELTEAGLILIGDQKVVAHLRGGNRPTVYDCNMRWAIQHATPELADLEWVENRGETELSTTNRGETRGETTAVALGTIGTTTTTLNNKTYAPERARAHEEIDASGDSLRGDSVKQTTAPDSSNESTTTAHPSIDVCPARPLLEAPHAFNKAGECIDCHALAPIGAHS